MKRLFKHEFYKLFQSLTLKIMMAVAAVVALFTTGLFALINWAGGSEISALLGLEGAQSVVFAFNNTDLHIYFAVMIALLVCSELRSKTMKNTLLADVSRAEVYAAKFVAMLVAITILILIHATIVIASSALILGTGPITGRVVLDGVSFFFMGLIVCYAVAAMLNFFAYLLQNTALVIVIAIVPATLLALVQTFGALLNIGFLQFIDKFSFLSILPNFAADKTLTNFAYYAVTVILMLVGFTGGGYLVFNKKEIK